MANRGDATRERLVAVADALDGPPPGCVFASFAYERAELRPKLHALIRERLDRWRGLYERKLAALMELRPPAAAVTAGDLAEMIVALIEGAFVTGNIRGDARLVQRQSRQFRTDLELLFRAPR